MDSPEPVLVLVRDLIFASRIVATARAEDVAMTLIRDAARLDVRTPGRAVILDLNEPGALERAAAWRRADPARRVVGFVSHTDAATIRAARDSGAVDRILARSEFTARLPEILRAARDAAAD